MPDEPKQPEAHNPRNEKPISLHPMSVEEALKRALRTRTDRQSTPAKPKQRHKPKKK